MEDSRAKRYAAERYKLILFNIFLSLLFLMLYQVFLSTRTAVFSSGLCRNYYGALVIYAIVFSTIQYLIAFPSHFYGSFLLEHRYGLSNQTITGWIADEFKKNMISVPVFMGFIVLFFFLLKIAGALWWIWATAIWLLFSLGFTRIMPTLIIPLFYKYSPIDNQALKDRIMSAARTAGIKLIDVFRINLSSKTKKANAAVVGIGGSRRVLLADTLMDNFTDDEILAVAAHEFAHHSLRHIPKLITGSVIATASGFYILSLLMNGVMAWLGAEYVYDMRLLPAFLFILTVFNLLVMPAQNWFSRFLEKEADLKAIEVTRDPSAFISVMEKLGKMNLSDFDPPRIMKYLFYDHPTLKERIDMARAFSIK